MSLSRPFRLPTVPLFFALASVGACTGEYASEAGDEPSGGSLGEPNASFPEDFGAIQTVRELRDGTVLVADPLGGALYRVDLDAGTRTVIGAEGQGPEEYRQPDAVWALPGDSTLLVDLGNGRMISLGPDQEFGSTSPLSAGSPRTGLVVAIPQAVDTDGYVYARSMAGGMRGSLPDSGVVLRVERGTLALDTVASFKVEDRSREVLNVDGGQDVRLVTVPLSSADAWGVAADGSVVVARSSDYHVEWFGRDGSVEVGAPSPFEPVAIGMAEKEEWNRNRGRSGGGVGVMIDMDSNGSMSTSFSRGGMTEARELDQYTWPDFLPPFYNGRIDVDHEDRAWVRRRAEGGADATYELFDRSGEYVTTYSLPNNRRLIGFGASSVYVVAFDEFDLNYLERYSFPGS
jgi:hypothetical protein